MKNLFSENATWNRYHAKKVVGKIVTFKYSDSPELIRGLCFTTTYAGMRRSITTVKVVTPDNKVLEIDSPCQVIKIEPAKW